MGRSSDVLIGLNAATAAIRAAAFDRRGHQLGFVALPNRWTRIGDLGAEHDLAETWQLVARALRRLAEAVPDLARRTTALAITGQPDGTWLIDDDGDPVGPALSWLDARAAPVVAAWRERGLAAAVARTTGTEPGPGVQAAQIAWLLQHRPEMVERAATALHCKDWLYFCCTGERATDPAEAVRSYGDLRTRAYADGVLARLGLAEAARLLPPITDGLRVQAALTPAAAAATRLREGTPVVLGPPEPLAAALGAGALAPEGDVGCSILGTAGVHVRVARVESGGPDAAGGSQSIVPFPGSEVCARMVVDPVAARPLEWLTGLVEELVADAGLIGLSRPELKALIDRKAADAASAGLLFRAFAGDGQAAVADVRAGLLGITERTGLGELARAILDGVALAIRDGHAALGDPPAELRIAGRAAGGRTLQRALAACLGRPVRRSRRDDLATAGAALPAAVALGYEAGVADGVATWVEPWLSDPEPVDQALHATYARLVDLHRESGRRLAGIARALPFEPAHPSP